MCFKTDITFKGVEIVDAYFCVKAVGGTKERKIIELHCYADESIYNVDKLNGTTDNALFIDTSNTFTPDYSENAENEHKQAYIYLKTTIYTNAVDC